MILEPGLLFPGCTNFTGLLPVFSSFTLNKCLSYLHLFVSISIYFPVLLCNWIIVLLKLVNCYGLILRWAMWPTGLLLLNWARWSFPLLITSAQLTLEFPVPMGILILPITACTSPIIPSSPVHIPRTPLCPCYPLCLSPVLPCLRLSSPVHLLSSPVFSCHPLLMPLSPLLFPSSNVGSLPAQWSVLCLLYKRSFAVKNHET